jgi:lipopolysaccharide export system permease protein
MTIIDRYLLRQFFRTFTICFLSLLGLFVVFHAFTNLDAFLKIASQQGGLWRVMGLYYAHQSVLFFDRTVGLVNLTAAMFTLTWIQRHNELIALMAAGISRVRVMIPVVLAVVVVIALGVLNRELVIPRFREELSRKPNDLAVDVPRPFTPQYDEQSDILIRGQAAIAAQRKIDRPVLRLPASLDHSYRQIAAKEAYYRPPADGRLGGYLLVGVEHPTDLGTQPSLVLDDSPVIVTARDAPDWLQPGQCFLVSGVTFEQLTNSEAWREFSSTAQLIRGLHNRSVDFGGSMRVAIHGRIVQPLLDLTLLFLGLPLVVTRESRNVFLAMGLCAAVTLAFMVVVVGFQYLGGAYALNPALAVWLPLMLFIPVAVEMSVPLTK